MSHYDVIVIGSGAGGGTLVRHLAPSGKRILLLERGDWLPREPQNWQAHDVFVDNRYVSADTWYDERGKPFQPQVHYCVGGATKLYGAALYRLRAEDFGELRHHDGISPAWPIAYDEMEPYYTLAEQLYEVHGARGRGPDRAAARARRTRSPPSATSRASSSSPTTSRPPGSGRSTRRAACGCSRRDMAFSHCVRCATCDGFPCLVHAKSDAEVLGVRPALEHPNVTLVTNAEAVRLETNAERHDGHRRGRRPRRRARDVHRRPRRRLVRRGEQRAAAARVGERGASGRARQRLGPGRPQLHVPQQPGGARAVEGREPDGVPEDARASTTSTSARRASTTRSGNIQMVGKSSAEMYRGEKPLQTRLAPERTLDEVARHAVDFWLSTEDLPRPENRVTLRDDGAIQLSYTPTNEEPKKRLLHELKSMLRHLGMHHDHLMPRHAYLKNDIPVAGCAHQAGTCRFGDRPRHVGARHRLPRARGRQPLRRRHELLPEHRGGEPGADRDGQRAARGRPPARAAGRATRRERGSRRACRRARARRRRRRRLRRPRAASSGSRARSTCGSR